MRKNKLNHNKEFMFAIMAMAVVVFCVVVFFWMWCFPQGTSETNFSSDYKILLDDTFKDDSVQLQVNDSVVFEQRIYKAEKITIAIPSKESAFLMLLMPEKDAAYSFNLPQGGGIVELSRKDNGVEIFEKK